MIHTEMDAEMIRDALRYRFLRKQQNDLLNGAHDGRCKFAVLKDVYYDLLDVFKTPEELDTIIDAEIF